MAEQERLSESFAENIFAATATPAMVVRVVNRANGKITTDTGTSDGIEASDALSCAEAIIAATLTHVRQKDCECSICTAQIGAMETLLAVFDLLRRGGRTDG